MESGGNNFEAQQEEQNRTGTEPLQQVTEQRIAKNEQDEGRGEENAEEKQNILAKIVEPMKKDNLPNLSEPMKK